MSDSYIGEVQAFRIGRQMIPFKVIKQDGCLLTIQSLDLEWQTEIFTDKWNKQKEILESIKEG